MLGKIDKFEFGVRLRGLIEGKGLTQKAAAASLGIPIPQMSRYLNGQTPDPAKLLTIAAWGGTTIEWLLTGKDLVSELAEMREASQSTGQSGAKGEKDQLEWKQLERAWPMLDPVSRGVLLRIITEVLEPRGFRAVLEYLQIVEHLMQMNAKNLNRSTKLQKRAAIISDVLLMCMSGLDAAERDVVSKEFERTYRKNIRRLIWGSSTEGLGNAQRAKKGAHRGAMERTMDKRIKAILERARSKALNSDELNELGNQSVTIARLFRAKDLTVDDSGAKQLGRLKKVLMKDLAQLHEWEFTEESWTEYCLHFTVMLTVPQSIAGQENSKPTPA